jgi:hypothetical protein
MKRIKALKALSMLVLGLASAVSQAEMVRFDFTAHGTAVDFGNGAAGDFPSGSASHFLSVGTTLSGYFFYDTSTPSIFYDTDSSGTYAGYTSPTHVGATFTSTTGYKFVPNSTAATDPLAIISDGVGGDTGAHDSIKVVAAQNLSPGVNQDIDITLTDKNNGKTWNSGALPPTLDLKDFDGTITFFWGDAQNNTFTFNANIDTLTQVAAVPEPETYAMLLAGLALVGVAKRRQQKGQQAVV